MKRYLHIGILTLSLFGAGLVSGCGEEQKAPQKELLAYVGITITKPMTEIFKLAEERFNVKIVLNQGGSEDLYNSLKKAKVGDIYMPGAPSYRRKHLSDGYLSDYVLVGYNQVAFFVSKGNPKVIKPDLKQMLREDVHVVLCNPESSSIGLETKHILQGENLFDPIFDRAEYLTTDSRNLNKAIHDGDADLVINWRATAFFSENRRQIDLIDLPPELTTPKELQLNLLSFSEHPDIVRKIMALVTSEEGQAIFRKFGFSDASGVKDTP